MRELADAIQRYLDECYARGEVARTSELAQQLGMTTVQFTRTCRRTLSVPPCRYFRERQVARACELLLTTSATVEQIATRCAFGTRSTFFRVFQQVRRCTPAEFRAGRRPS